ncbi:MAG: alpha/beta hydrolase [SAR324 cluster bacterium]|nr:alpha/beta hydrolase [SAR324 cluster bacterium]
MKTKWSKFLISIPRTNPTRKYPGKTFTFFILTGLLLVSGCNQLFYNPSPWQYLNPQQMGLQYKDVYFHSEDGTKLHGWFVPAQSKNAKGTVIHYHGNAENLSHYFFHVFFIPQQNYNLFMFDYRGYGQSEGEAEPKGIYEDALAALNYVQSRADVDSTKLIVFGQSLGGALALRLMGDLKPAGIAGVVTEGAFYTYQQIAEEKMAEVWFTKLLKYPLSQLLFHDDYAPAPVIKNISPIPLLIVHGSRDDVVPYHHGIQIFEAAREPKWMWTIENGRHIQMLSKYRSIYRDRLIAFFDRSIDSGAASSGQKQGSLSK